MGEYREVKQLAGCSERQVYIAVRNIARFHAAWWDHASLDHHRWLEPLSEYAYGSSLGSWLRSYHGDWPPALKNLAPRTVEHYAQLRTQISTPPRTIVHGDFPSQNMIFAARRGQRQFALIDYQMVALGRGVVDLARFFATSLRPELRRSIEMDLLRTYHSILEAGGVRDYEFDQCLHDFRLGLLWDLVSWLAWDGNRISSSGSNWRRRIPIMERRLQTVRDWDAESLLPD